MGPNMNNDSSQKGPLLGPRGPGGRGQDGPMGPGQGGPMGPGQGGPMGPGQGGPMGPGQGRPMGPGQGRPMGPGHGGPMGPGHGGPMGPGHDGPMGPGHGGPMDPSEGGPMGPGPGPFNSGGPNQSGPGSNRGSPAGFNQRHPGGPGGPSQLSPSGHSHGGPPKEGGRGRGGPFKSRWGANPNLADDDDEDDEGPPPNWNSNQNMNDDGWNHGPGQWNNNRGPSNWMGGPNNQGPQSWNNNNAPPNNWGEDSNHRFPNSQGGRGGSRGYDKNKRGRSDRGGDSFSDKEGRGKPVNKSKPKEEDESDSPWEAIKDVQRFNIKAESSDDQSAAASTPKQKPVQPSKKKATTDDEGETVMSHQGQSRATGNVLALFRQKVKEEGPGSIPGLDLPTSEDKSKSNAKKATSSPSKSQGTKRSMSKEPTDDKIDVNFEEGSRLNIGPIGVDSKAKKWKPPQDWYEDDDENDHSGGGESSGKDKSGRDSNRRDGSDSFSERSGRGGMKGRRNNDGPGGRGKVPILSNPNNSEGLMGPGPGMFGSPFGGPGPRGPGMMGPGPGPFGGGPRFGGPGPGPFGMQGPGPGPGNPFMNPFGGGPGGPQGPGMFCGPGGPNGPFGPQGNQGPMGPGGPGPGFDSGRGRGGNRGGRGGRNNRPEPLMSMELPGPPYSGEGGGRNNFGRGGKNGPNQSKGRPFFELGASDTNHPPHQFTRHTNDPPDSDDERDGMKSRDYEKPQFENSNKQFDALPIGKEVVTIDDLISDREIENGGSAPRILCLDDYFMIEVEKLVKEPDTGKMMMEYEYEAHLEDQYRQALVRSFKKQIDEGFFPFIIIDCVYVGEIEVDVQTCYHRNIHNRTLKDLQKMALKWQPPPPDVIQLDLTSYIQDADIQEVEMEDCSQEDEVSANVEEVVSLDDDDDQENETFKVIKELMKSKWDTDESQEEKLDKLDGFKSAKKRLGESKPQSIEDWLQLSKEYERKKTQPGKKSVRWADIEERNRQSSARDRGFVLGQTDWERMTDPSFGSNALVQVRYIEPREKNV
ncbi:YLP motif-containing protein 1 [Armadillidium nasatum]|uniref:YLP motif-containing protein 1 n=1 Tax=Armadillidium nasatum TaxID=96803 RepID=A0A5N5TA02_9CRUS|nr:YLP motif-containing protein 1 [Armadillidium nasatum]